MNPYLTISDIMQEVKSEWSQRHEMHMKARIWLMLVQLAALAVNAFIKWVNHATRED